MSTGGASCGLQHSHQTLWAQDVVAAQRPGGGKAQAQSGCPTSRTESVGVKNGLYSFLSPSIRCRPTCHGNIVDEHWVRGVGRTAGWDGIARGGIEPTTELARTLSCSLHGIVWQVDIAESRRYSVLVPGFIEGVVWDAAKDVFMQMNCTPTLKSGPISGSLAHGCARPTES